MKNPNPGFATERQVDYLCVVLKGAGWTISEEIRVKARTLTQAQMQAATDKAQHLKSEHTGNPLPPWVRT